MSYHHDQTNGENAIDRILGTTILWIFIPFAIHILNYVRISMSNLSIGQQAFEHQNEFFEWYVNSLNLLRPNLELAFIHLGLILVGVVFTLVSLRGILRPIYTIIGIVFAMWLSNVIGLDALLTNYPENDNIVPTENMLEEKTNLKQADNKLVCHETASPQVAQILSEYDISKIITYNCKLEIDNIGNGSLTCPNNWPRTYQFADIKSFQTNHANLLITDSDMIQFKHLGTSITCF